jgi:hypothetical protein
VIESGERGAFPDGRDVVLRSLLAVVIVACTVLLVWSSVFMVNDDAAMSALASGDYTGHPSAHLVFVSAFLGLILAGLHNIAQPVPWYAYMLIAIDVCSISCLIAVAYARRNQLRERGQIAVVVLIGVFLPILLLRPTFTVTAIVVCVTGLVMIAGAVRSGTHSKLLLWFGSLCVGLGAMVRFDSFVGVVAVFLPFIALVAISLGWRRSLVVVCIVTAIVVSSSVTNHALNSSSSWSSYLEFNDALGPLIGNTDFERAIANPADPAVAKVLTSIGWNTDDIELLNNWFFYDRNVYSTEHLSALVSLTSGAKFNAPLSESALLVLRSQRPLWILAVGLGITVLASRRWRTWILILIQLTWCAAVFTVTASSQRFPDRVSIPMYLALGIVLTLGIPLVLNERTPRQTTRPSGRKAWLAIPLAICLLAGFYLLSDSYAPWQISRANQTTIAKYHDQLQVLDGIDPSGRYLCLGATLTIEGTDALATTSGYRANKVLCTGWPMFSPSFEQRQESLGIASTILDTLATDSHTYLILAPPTVPVFQRLYLRYSKLNVELEAVGHLTNGAVVTRVRIVPASTHTVD